MFDVYLGGLSVRVSANPKSGRLTIHKTKKMNVFQYHTIRISVLAGMCCGLSSVSLVALTEKDSKYMS